MNGSIYLLRGLIFGELHSVFCVSKIGRTHLSLIAFQYDIKIGNQCASKLTEKTGWKHKEANEFCDSRENLGYHASRGGRHFPENEYEGHFLLSLSVISMKIHLTTGWTC